MPEETFNAKAADDVVIRPATESDGPVLRELFVESLLEGHLRDNDTGFDLESLQDTYFSEDGQSGFWVGELSGAVVAMIGVLRVNDNTAEIRRLRVAPQARRRGIGGRMLEQAVKFCKHHGYLKVRLDVRIERGPAIALFEKCGFTLGRTRDVEGHKMLDFYIDLYSDPGA